jgi:hypothetical protein
MGWSGMVAPRCLFKSVHELTDTEISQYIGLFNAMFSESIDREEFLEKFTRRIGRETYFVLLVHAIDGIVGSLGAIEVPYLFAGKEYKFALTVDGMISPSWRGDWLALKRMHELLVAELVRRGFVYLFTKPNNNSYLYLKQVIGTSDLGDLIAYVLPLRPFQLLHRGLSFLDHPWSWLLGAASRLGGTERQFRPCCVDDIAPMLTPRLHPGIHRDRNIGYLRIRYAHDRYRWVSTRERFVIYTIRRYAGRKTCLVLEAPGLRMKDWFAFLRHLLSTNGDIEMVLHVVGRRSPHFPLVRISSFLLPNKFHVVGRPIGPRVLPAYATLSVDLSDFEMV